MAWCWRAAGQSLEHPAPCHGSDPFTFLQKPSRCSLRAALPHSTQCCSPSARPPGSASHDPSPCSPPGPVIPLLFLLFASCQAPLPASFHLPHAPEASRSTRNNQHLPNPLLHHPTQLPLLLLEALSLAGPGCLRTQLLRKAALLRRTKAARMQMMGTVSPIAFNY